MKAIGIKQSLPVSDPSSFIEFETTTPKPLGRDLLVKINAVSVNPVDFKIRQGAAKGKELADPKVLGWDAVGIVEGIGDGVTLFQEGDKVYYAGDISRSGSNAEYQLVDERIVGYAPKTLEGVQIASMPLTALTAWEILFDRMRISQQRDKNKTLLVIGGAGGVGSVAIQLAKYVGLEVIATASRPESVDWCKNMGADHVVNHNDLIEEVQKAGLKHVDYIVDFVDTNSYWDTMVELIKPQGHIASITGSTEPVVLNKLKNKSVTFSWELMYTRSMFQTDDMVDQHHILNKVANLLDTKVLKSTLNTVLEGFTTENFREAHRLSESGKVIGKVVVKY